MRVSIVVAPPPVGIFAVTTTSVGGPLAPTPSFTVVVNAAPAPNFSLSATPASQTVVQGASTTYTVNITPLGGFSGAVSLSATGLPAGASASFTPNPATSSSTMTVSTDATTPRGSFPATLIGPSGTLTH